MIKPWRWAESLSERTPRGGRVWHLKDGRNRNRATIWEHGGGIDGDFVWHTWDENGTGGENSSATTVIIAKDECVAAIVRQGWAPGGWEVAWS